MLTLAATVIFHNPFETSFTVLLTLRGYGFLLGIFLREVLQVFDSFQSCLKDEDVRMDDS